MVEAARRGAALDAERSRLASAIAGWALKDAGRGLWGRAGGAVVSRERRREMFFKRRERKRARALCGHEGAARSGREVRERGRRAFRADFLLRAMVQ